MPKPVLGRGLDSLLNDEDLPGLGEDPDGGILGEDRFSGDAVVMLALDRLNPSPGQPRKHFAEDELRELADSIAEHGIIQPIIVAKAGDNYTIIAGERRTRAARLAGLTEIPAIVRSYGEQSRLEVSLIENIQRSDLNPVEEAAAYKNLMDFAGLSQEELAAKVGKNRSTVANALRLLKLPDAMQRSLESGSLSAGHARALLSVQDDRLRNDLFGEITRKALSVREAERRALQLNAPQEEREPNEPGRKRPPELVEMEERFIERLGTKVSIEGGLEKGCIRIEYYSMEDLDRLHDILGNEG
ncbi:MAG: ParB/RepB/Spo0J family partition protein [Treponema sp.]|nr:ParB/RepB/Spo0J family partition protein [Treponema sp.]